MDVTGRRSPRTRSDDQEADHRIELRSLVATPWRLPPDPHDRRPWAAGARQGWRQARRARRQRPMICAGRPGKRRRAANELHPFRCAARSAGAFVFISSNPYRITHGHASFPPRSRPIGASGRAGSAHVLLIWTRAIESADGARAREKAIV